MLFVIFIMAANSALQHTIRLLPSVDDGSDDDGSRYLISLLSIQAMHECVNSCEGSVVEGYVVRKIGGFNRLAYPIVPKTSETIRWR